MVNAFHPDSALQIIDIESFKQETGIEDIWIALARQQWFDNYEGFGGISPESIKYKKYLEENGMRVAIVQNVLDYTTDDNLKIDIDVAEVDDFVNLIAPKLGNKIVNVVDGEGNTKTYKIENGIVTDKPNYQIEHFNEEINNER